MPEFKRGFALSLLACGLLLSGCSIQRVIGGSGGNGGAGGNGGNGGSGGTNNVSISRVENSNGTVVISISEEGKTVVGSGVKKMETRKVGNFMKITNQGSADVDVRVGSAPSVKVEADDNLLSLIKTRIQGDTLNINVKGSYTTHNPLLVHVTVPQLEAFHLDGSGDTTLTGLKGDRFNAKITGSGDMKASGTTGSLDITIDGSGDLECFDLQAKTVTVNINGSGDAKVYASQSLKVEINGSGDVEYKGNPDHVERQINGSGEVAVAR